MEGDPIKISEVPEEKKIRNRRGKGSRTKQTEAFRSKKNYGFDNELVKKIEDLKISFGYTPRDLFGERMMSSIVRPQIKFPINLDIVGELCIRVVEVLHGACKIPITGEAIDMEIEQYDLETLMWMTALQLECKLQYACTGTQILPSLDREMCFRTERVAMLMKKALTPLAVVIDQVGRFLVADQLFVPTINNDQDFVYYRLMDINNQSRSHFPCFSTIGQPGVATPFKNHVGKQMYAIADPQRAADLIKAGIVNLDGLTFCDEFLRDPSHYPYIGLVEFVPECSSPQPLPFDVVLRRYVELEGRVSKKLANAFVEIDLSSGKGVESQLVFRRDLGNSVVVAWSPRSLRADALELGAILNLGYPCDLGSEAIAAVSTTVDTSAGIEVLANLLTKKLR